MLLKLYVGMVAESYQSSRSLENVLQQVPKIEKASDGGGRTAKLVCQKPIERAVT